LEQRFGSHRYAGRNGSAQVSPASVNSIKSCCRPEINDDAWSPIKVECSDSIHQSVSTYGFRWLVSIADAQTECARDDKGVNAEKSLRHLNDACSHWRHDAAQHDCIDFAHLALLPSQEISHCPKVLFSGSPNLRPNSPSP